CVCWCLSVSVYLLSECEVFHKAHAPGVGDEECDGLHDVPGEHVPGEVSQEASLQRHEGHAPPHITHGLDLRTGLHTSPILSHTHKHAHTHHTHTNTHTHTHTIQEATYVSLTHTT